MKLTYKIIIGVLITAITGGLLYHEIFRQPSSVAGKKADYRVTAVQLAGEYFQDESEGNKKYLGKILQVSGEIYEIDGGTPLTVVLKGSKDTMIRAELQEAPETLPETGDHVQIVGNCSGILLDVVLNNAVIISN